MALVILATDTNATHTTGHGESTVIPEGVIRASSAGDTIDMAGVGVVLTVDGTIYAEADGVNVSGSGARIIVGETGAIRGVDHNVSFGVTVPSTLTVGVSLTNFGAITGTGALSAHGSAAFTLANHGTMSGASTGVSVGGSARITNTGLIEGQSSYGVYSSGAASELVNHGTILGHASAVQLGANAALINLGTISSVSGDGVYMQQGTVYNYGTIAGGTAIPGNGIAFNDLSASKVVNAGQIVGNVVFKTQADTYKALGDGQVLGSVLGGAGGDTLTGGAQADDLSGQNGNDLLRGRGGDDTLKGGAGDDILRGGIGDDTLEGGNDSDLLRGGAGDDTMDGGAQGDRLFGGQGDDDMNGGGGADVLTGGRGENLLTGGQGADVFVMTRQTENDTITDFKDGVDRIDLSAFGLLPADYATDVAPALKAAGAGAVRLDLGAFGGAGALLVIGTSLADMDVTDFLF